MEFICFSIFVSNTNYVLIPSAPSVAIARVAPALPTLSNDSSNSSSDSSSTLTNSTCSNSSSSSSSTPTSPLNAPVVIRQSVAGARASNEHKRHSFNVLTNVHHSDPTILSNLLQHSNRWVSYLQYLTQKSSNIYTPPNIVTRLKSCVQAINLLKLPSLHKHPIPVLPFNRKTNPECKHDDRIPQQLYQNLLVKRQLAERHRREFRNWSTFRLFQRTMWLFIPTNRRNPMSWN